jgi:hypothetical protein
LTILRHGIKTNGKAESYFCEKGVDKMKASMWSQKNLIMIWAACLVILISPLMDCQRRLPTMPSTRDLTLLGTATGVIGSLDAVFQQDVYQDNETEEIVSIFQFANIVGRVLGKAELTAALDLVNFISDKTFQIPGSATFDIGTYFTIQITISLPVARPNYYQVEVILTDNSDKVTVFIPKKPILGKYNLNKENNADSDAPPLINAALADIIVLLCLGSEETVMESQDCLANSVSYCNKRGVSDAYIQGSMSLESGCEKSCYVICKNHDQGKIGG